jgi:hypothetical protein
MSKLANSNHASTITISSLYSITVMLIQISSNHHSQKTFTGISSFFTNFLRSAIDCVGA